MCCQIFFYNNKNIITNQYRDNLFLFAAFFGIPLRKPYLLIGPKMELDFQVFVPMSMSSLDVWCIAVVNITRGQRFPKKRTVLLFGPPFSGLSEHCFKEGELN